MSGLVALTGPRIVCWIPVSDYGETLHIDNLSPKYNLGNRPLSGKEVLSKGEFKGFEANFVDVDDFLMPAKPNAKERGRKNLM